MSWIIVCDKRDTICEVLFMVDRKKQQKSFWSNRLTDAFTFKNEEAAKSICKKLKFNNPRVVPFKEARRLEENNMSLSAEYPEGWDEHKDCI